MPGTRGGSRIRTHSKRAAALLTSGLLVLACAEERDAAPAPPEPTVPAAPPEDAVPAPDQPAPEPEPVSPPAPAPSPAPEEAAPAPAEPSTTVTMDLEELAERVEKSRALGVFTKLKLKNEFDDLRADLRAYYDGRVSPTLVELRESYDLLLMKLLALIEDDDAELSRDLLASREDIWIALNDPVTLSGS